MHIEQAEQAPLSVTSEKTYEASQELKNMESTTYIEQLEIKVNLGVTPEERQYPQSIWLDMSWKTKTLPQGCITDHIDDTICYDQLIQEIKAHLKGQSFQLIEHLGYTLFHLCRKHIPPKASIKLSIYKKPPIEGLHRVAFQLKA